ncbi:hypothetical protein C8Q80DRAFT_122838 [Daedaleopsis nitida]|nr:hypothetical protein C8Q80DRAFT_122838 [Daedaleopsis nitida]
MSRAPDVSTARNRAHSTARTPQGQTPRACADPPRSATSSSRRFHYITKRRSLPALAQAGNDVEPCQGYHAPRDHRKATSCTTSRRHEVSSNLPHHSPKSCPAPLSLREEVRPNVSHRPSPFLPATDEVETSAMPRTSAVDVGASARGCTRPVCARAPPETRHTPYRVLHSHIAPSIRQTSRDGCASARDDLTGSRIPLSSPVSWASGRTSAVYLGRGAADGADALCSAQRHRPTSATSRSWT